MSRLLIVALAALSLTGLVGCYESPDVKLHEVTVIR